jgi:hypothetical protein
MVFVYGKSCLVRAFRIVSSALRPDTPSSSPVSETFVPNTFLGVKLDFKALVLY